MSKLLSYHSNTAEITCPHCDHEYQDSWEFSDAGETRCTNCEKRFSYERSSVYYTRALTTEEEAGS